MRTGPLLEPAATPPRQEATRIWWCGRRATCSRRRRDKSAGRDNQTTGTDCMVPLTRPILVTARQDPSRFGLTPTVAAGVGPGRCRLSDQTEVSRLRDRGRRMPSQARRPRRVRPDPARGLHGLRYQSGRRGRPDPRTSIELAFSGSNPRQTCRPSTRGGSVKKAAGVQITVAPSRPSGHSRSVPAGDRGRPRRPRSRRPGRPSVARRPGRRHPAMVKETCVG